MSERRLEPTWQPTALNVSFLTVIGWALVLGVLAGRADVLVIAVPLILALLAARRSASRPEWQLTRETSADRVFEAGHITVTATIAARTALPLIEVLEPLPSLVRLDRGRNHAFFSLRHGECVQWSFELACPGRQRIRLGGPHVRVWDPLGLTALETRERAPAIVSVYPRVTPLRNLPRPVTTQTSVGNHVSPAQGQGIEPGEIRPFVPGDRIRRVNWRATLRLGTLHVTEHHRERNADVVLMLDTLSAAGPDGRSTVDIAVHGAAALAAGYLARKDRVGLIEYGGVLRWVKPATGRGHFDRLMESLLGAEVVFTYVARDLDLVPPRVLPPGALVIALSPLLDTRFVTAATNLAARGFDLVVIAVSPIAATCAEVRRRAATAPLGTLDITIPRGPVLDLAARLWALERRAQLDELRRGGLTIVDWDGVAPLATALATLRRPRSRALLA